MLIGYIGLYYKSFDFEHSQRELVLQVYQLGRIKKRASTLFNQLRYIHSQPTTLLSLHLNALLIVLVLDTEL